MASPSQPSPNPLGGATGGLYRIFDRLGEAFIALLFGWNRASLPKFSLARVVLGGMISMTLCGGIFGISMVSTDPSAILFSASNPPQYRFGAGCALGAVAGFFLGGILVIIEKA